MYHTHITRTSQVKALARRGAAYCQQGKYMEALEDYKKAVMCSPVYDESLIGLTLYPNLKKIQTRTQTPRPNQNPNPNPNQTPHLYPKPDPDPTACP